MYARFSNIASTATTSRFAEAITTEYIPMLEPQSKNTASGYKVIALSMVETARPSNAPESSMIFETALSIRSGLMHMIVINPEKLER